MEHNNLYEVNEVKNYDSHEEKSAFTDFLLKPVQDEFPRVETQAPG